MKVGDKVALKTRRSIEVVEIVRETPTQWVIKNGDKFYKKDLKQVGYDVWEPRRLMELTGEVATQIARHALIQRKEYIWFEILRQQFPKHLSVEELQSFLDKIRDAR